MRLFRIMMLAATALIGSAAPGLAQSYTFNTTGSMPDNGTYGNALTFGTTTASALQMRVTGWQVNQSTNAITSAWVGAYSPGMGVTGLGDMNGDQNYHQIDNAGGYTDFVLLQFNTPVAITALNLSSFLLGAAKTKDNDFAFYAASFPETAWNSAINLSSHPAIPSQWTTVADSGADGLVPTGIHDLSSQWLIGAAFSSGNNDGFKIKSINVTTSVPEPATWGSMILGMGVIGGSLRRRRRLVPVPATA